jgi:hypothetical protein
MPSLPGKRARSQPRNRWARGLLLNNPRLEARRINAGKNWVEQLQKISGYDRHCREAKR